MKHKQEQTEVNKICCPKCKNQQIKKDGKRKTQNRGLIQRYRCKNCNYRFVKDEGFYRMRNNPKKITLCLDLFFKGISTRQIQQHLNAFYPQNSHYSNIYRWVVKYSKIISKFTNKLNLKTGQEIQIDEMQYKTKGKESWFIDSIDCDTRFMVNAEYVKSREKNKIKQMVLDIKDKTKEVKTITTDGFLLYTKVIKKTFGYNNQTRKYNINHNVVNASAGEGFNHKIERLHNTIRLRTKTFRGFHGSLESADAIMKGYAIYYNFIRKHLALNCCPYELATNLKLKSENKWLELIKKANIL